VVEEDLEKTFSDEREAFGLGDFGNKLPTWDNLQK
jgi:hypothetical protein